MNSQPPLEEWRDIPGYNGKYQMSNLGRVKSLIKQTWRYGTLPKNKKETILNGCVRCGRLTYYLVTKLGGRQHSKCSLMKLTWPELSVETGDGQQD